MLLSHLWTRQVCSKVRRGPLPRFCVLQCHFLTLSLEIRPPCLADSPADASSAQLQLSDETRLLLYALRQQAQQGANNAPKPWGWNVVESAKWTAWAQLGNMSKTEAMFRFVQQLEYDEPSWW